MIPIRLLLQELSEKEVCKVNPYLMKHSSSLWEKITLSTIGIYQNKVSFEGMYISFQYFIFSILCHYIILLYLIGFYLIWLHMIHNFSLVSLMWPELIAQIRSYVIFYFISIILFGLVWFNIILCFPSTSYTYIFLNWLSWLILYPF